MGFREQEALKQFREEEAERERLEEEKRLAPIKAAEEQIKNTTRELLAIQKDNILKLPDDELYIAPELAGATMTWEQAAEFNRAESHKFVEACPEYYPCDENRRQLYDYFERQASCNIINAAMWEAAFRKLDNLGLMIHRPAPEPEPIREQVPEHVEPVQEPSPYSVGRDLQTGELREYTPYEIEKMSAGEFRMAFNLRSIYGRTIDPRDGREVTQ